MSTTHKYKTYLINISPDNYPLNPRTDYDPFGAMICFHPQYSLGDEHHYKDPEHFIYALWDEHATIKEKREFILKHCKADQSLARKLLLDNSSKDTDSIFQDLVEYYVPLTEFPSNIIALPLYLYDHSGITMSVSSFSCQFDSGQVGWTYTTLSDAQKNFPSVTGQNELIEEATNMLVAEVKTYDQYLRGDIWGFEITDALGIEVDSCWGFYGEDDCLAEAQSIIDHITENQAVA